MMLIPDVVSVSQMREPAKIFELVQNGPVILTQRSKSAAVLVSIDDWNERERYVEILEAKLRYLEINAHLSAFSVQVKPNDCNHVYGPSANASPS